MNNLSQYITEKLKLTKDIKEETLIIDDELEEWIKPIEDFIKDNITLDEKYYTINCVKEDWPNGPLNKIQFSTGVITTHSKELEELPEKIRKFLNDNNIKNETIGDMNSRKIFFINIKLYK